MTAHAVCLRCRKALADIARLSVWSPEPGVQNFGTLFRCPGCQYEVVVVLDSDARSADEPSDDDFVLAERNW